MSDTSHLMIRKDYVLCTRCFATEPVHVGGGMPMPTFIKALEMVARRHPAKKHRNPLGEAPDA